MKPAAADRLSAVLDRHLDPGADSPVIVAFSGGSDSTALLLIARDWALRAGRPLLALTVDHHLNPESAAWTVAAGMTARRLGAAWKALSWEGPKPATGLPAAARTARHALLADATRLAGGCVLLLGHTSDDIAESELIRRDTPSHGRLQVWSPSPAWPHGRGVFLLRPLLTARRSELRAFVKGLGFGWLDDPGNADPRFARTRARLSLTAGPAAAALPAPDAPAFGSGLGRVVETQGLVMLDRGQLLTSPQAARWLGRAILCVSGRGTPPSRAAVERLLGRLAGDARAAAVLGGARVQADGARLHISRELGRHRPQPLQIGGDGASVFDGRFEITGAPKGWRVEALAGSQARLAKADRDALHLLPAEGRPSLPVLHDPDGGVSLMAPLGQGSARARSLVGARLRAAMGLIKTENAAVQDASTGEAHGGLGEVVLSCPAETQFSRQAAAARRSAACPRRERA